MAKYFTSAYNKRDFAPVAPVNVLKGLAAAGHLGGYHLFLSHNIIEQKEAFVSLVSDNIQLQYGSTIIIDNSVIELGKPVDAEMISAAHGILNAAMKQYRSELVCVLPDELLDGQKTVQVAVKALAEFRYRKLDNLMYVPQGKTFAEIVKCAEAFQHVEEVKWIGVAKNFVGVLGSRHEITQVLQSIFPNAKFHMLGFSRNMIDDILCTRLPGVEGIDSSMPMRLTHPVTMYSEFPKRGDWWKEDLECNEHMIENVKRIRRWLGHV